MVSHLSFDLTASLNTANEAHTGRHEAKQQSRYRSDAHTLAFRTDNSPDGNHGGQ